MEQPFGWDLLLALICVGLLDVVGSILAGTMMLNNAVGGYSLLIPADQQ